MGWRGSGSSGSENSSSYILASRQYTVSTTYEIVGVEKLSLKGPQIFKVTCKAPAGFVLHIIVADITDSETQLCEVQTPSTNPVYLEADLTPADDSERMYAIEMKLTGGTPTVNDRGICYVGKLVSGSIELIPVEQ